MAVVLATSLWRKTIISSAVSMVSVAVLVSKVRWAAATLSGVRRKVRVPLGNVCRDRLWVHTPASFAISPSEENCIYKVIMYMSTPDDKPIRHIVPFPLSILTGFRDQILQSRNLVTKPNEVEIGLVLLKSYRL